MPERSRLWLLMCLYLNLQAYQGLNVFQNIRYRPNKITLPRTKDYTNQILKAYPDGFVDSSNEKFSISLFFKDEKKLEKLGQKCFSWGIFSGLAYILEPFWGIIFGTFFLSFLGNSMVETIQKIVQKLQDKLNIKKSIPRRLFSAIYIVSFLTLISKFILTIFPMIGSEAQYFISILQSENPYRLVSTAISNNFGAEALAKCEETLIAFLGENGRAFAGYDSRIADQTLRFGKLLQVY